MPPAAPVDGVGTAPADALADWSCLFFRVRFTMTWLCWWTTVVWWLAMMPATAAAIVASDASIPVNDLNQPAILALKPTLGVFGVLDIFPAPHICDLDLQHPAMA